MFEIIRRYYMPSAWYAQIQMPDGQRLELKIRSEAAPSAQEFLTLAQHYWDEQQAMLQPTIEVEAEDGYII